MVCDVSAVVPVPTVGRCLDSVGLRNDSIIFRLFCRTRQNRPILCAVLHSPGIMFAIHTLGNDAQWRQAKYYISRHPFSKSRRIWSAGRKRRSLNLETKFSPPGGRFLSCIHCKFMGVELVHLSNSHNSVAFNLDKRPYQVPNCCLTPFQWVKMSKIHKFSWRYWHFRKCYMKSEPTTTLRYICIRIGIFDSFSPIVMGEMILEHSTNFCSFIQFFGRTVGLERLYFAYFKIASSTGTRVGSILIHN